MSNTSQEDGTIKGHTVKWTGEEPPTYRAVWTDEPGVTRFEKTTAPTSSKGGEQEAMKKPATEILSQH